MDEIKTKKCETCGEEYQYSSDEELKTFFYYKKTHSGNYFRNTCIPCERDQKRKKYKEGKYNYKKKREYDYFSGISVNTSNRNAWYD